MPDREGCSVGEASRTLVWLRCQGTHLGRFPCLEARASRAVSTGVMATSRGEDYPVPRAGYDSTGDCHATTCERPDRGVHSRVADRAGGNPGQFRRCARAGRRVRSSDCALRAEPRPRHRAQCDDDERQRPVPRRAPHFDDSDRPAMDPVGGRDVVDHRGQRGGSALRTERDRAGGWTTDHHVDADPQWHRRRVVLVRPVR